MKHWGLASIWAKQGAFIVTDIYSKYARAFAARCGRPTCPAALRLGELLFELREGSQTVAKTTVELAADFAAGWRSLARAA